MADATNRLISLGWTTTLYQLSAQRNHWILFALCLMLRSRQHLSVSRLRTDITLSLCVCLDMPHASQSFPSQAHHTCLYNPPQCQPTLRSSSRIYTVKNLVTSHKESAQMSGCFAYRFGWSLSILYYNLQLLYLFSYFNFLPGSSC